MTVNFPKRVEDIQKFMVTQHPSSRMRSLHTTLKSTTGCVERTKLVGQMYSEYMKICLANDSAIHESTHNLFSGVKNIILKNTFWPIDVETRKKGTRDDFLEETLKWLNGKLPYFHNLRLNMHKKNQLLVGKVQSGKTAASIAFSMVKMLEGQPCIMVLLNSIGSTHQIENKCQRFFAEHFLCMNKIFYNFEQFGVVIAGDMSQKGEAEEKDLLNYHNTVEAMQGRSNNVILVMNNGHQLQYMNRVIREFETIPFTLICDEADAVAYGLVKEDRSNINAAFEFATLKMCSVQSVEVSATVWDILVGNRDLTSCAITEITTTGPYKRTSDLITNTFPIKMPNKADDIDPNLVPFYMDLSSVLPYGVMYNRSTPHPVVVLHKTNTKHSHHDAFVTLFRTHPVFSSIWCIIREDSRGVLVSSTEMADQNIIIGDFTAPANDEGIFVFPKKIDIQQVLFKLKHLSHIVIKSGGCCSRSKSYVSEDGDIHLTHEYYYPGAKERSDMPSIVQAVRLHHNRPDAVPLTLMTSKQIASDLRKGDLMQAEQIERLVTLENSCNTSDHVSEEVWNKNKVPKAKMTHGKSNKGFKVTKVPVDGGWSIDFYRNEMKKVVPDADLETRRDEELPCVLIPADNITGDVETQIFIDLSIALTSLGLSSWHRRADVQTTMSTTFSDKYGTYIQQQRFKATTKVWGRNPKKHTPCYDNTHGLLMKKNNGEWEIKLNRI
jgi:hypothetical protein